MLPGELYRYATLRYEKSVGYAPLMPTNSTFETLPINARIKISGLWTSIMFVIAYVDIFGFYRSDYRADIEAGEISGFTINQSFLLGTTIYVVVPSLMVFLSLVLRPRVNRIANITLSILYGLVIVAGAIGEWNYYILASTIEVALLAVIAYVAWTWPQVPTPVSAVSREATPARAPHAAR